MNKQMITFTVEFDMYKRIKTHLANSCESEPMPHAYVLRTLLRLWLEGDIPLTPEDVKDLGRLEVERELA